MLIDKKSLETRQDELVCKGKCQLPRLVEMATHDDLTRVLNRKAILASIENEIRKVFRHKYSLSILLIDLDHFKNINDTMGHLKGDFVLKESSKKMGEALRHEDFLGRYGGDEFLAVLPFTDFNGAMVVANRLISDFKKNPLSHGKTMIPQTVSIGTATHIPGESATILLERADRALYQAKNEGRGRCKGI
ncbi:MAG: GGDEF domain-containing protein [Nitrospiria bacterium]